MKFDKNGVFMFTIQTGYILSCPRKWELGWSNSKSCLIEYTWTFRSKNNFVTVVPTRHSLHWLLPWHEQSRNGCSWKAKSSGKSGRVTRGHMCLVELHDMKLNKISIIVISNLTNSLKELPVMPETKPKWPSLCGQFEKEV